jgi:hypothetical protein
MVEGVDLGIYFLIFHRILLVQKVLVVFFVVWAVPVFLPWRMKYANNIYVEDPRVAWRDTVSYTPNSRRTPVLRIIFAIFQ